MKLSRVMPLGIFLFLFTLKSIAQTNPPPMAMPEEKNTTLIDQIIKVTNHEKYFVEYCSGKVKAHAQKNNWSAEKTSEILGSIKFKYYSSTIYNSYSFYSTEQLKKLLDGLTVFSSGETNGLGMILTNSMMQSNLELFVESVIEGKYVIKNR